MADDLIPYNEFSKYWDPIRLKRLFKVMTIVGITGIIVGITSDNRRFTGASVASIDAATTGHLILSLLGY